MKLTVTKPVEIEVYSILVNVPVRYGVEDIPADFPCRRPWRKGDTGEGNRDRYDRWEVVIDIETGLIRNWPKGAAGRIEMKVCDEGNYTLYDGNGDEVATIRENYVPACVPTGGDYIELEIGEDGRIKDWRCDPDDVRSGFFPRED